MIDVRNVSYDYPSGRALHDVSFVLRPGAVLALVGPNGAGKSTLMRCIAALDAPAEGTIGVAGRDTRADPRGVHRALGYLPDFYGLYDALTVERSLVYAARSRGVAAERALRAAEAAAERVGLADRMAARAGELSRGLRQRLAIGQCIVHRPEVLLLDEPAAGLDPEARRELSALIRDLSADGATIMVSSHILAELEDYCSDMLMLREGRMAGDGVVPAGAAARRPPVIRVEVVFAEARPQLAGDLAALGLVVEDLKGAQAVLRMAPEPAQLAEALARMVAAGLPVAGFAPARASLEQTYMDELAKADTAVPATPAAAAEADG
jgi:ABC-2 type transport system ATP-binding protein